MKALREKKNKLKIAICEVRDKLLNGIEDKEIDEESTTILYGKLIDLLNEFCHVCNDLEAEWNIYGEVDKIARLKAEYDRVKEDIGEITTMTNEYFEYLHGKRYERKIPMSQELTAQVEKATELDKMIADLETTLKQARRQQGELYSQLGIPVKSSTPITSRVPRLSSLDTHDQENNRIVNNTRNDDDLEEALKRIPEIKVPRSPSERYATRSQRREESAGTSYVEDPLKGLKKLPVPKFKGDKRAFESWYAGFHQTVGKHESVPSEQKLLRLYDCLEGEALRTIQNLGYSAAAYEVAINRLTRKYGGKRREISMRLDDLDRFRRVREGNAADLEQFAEMLDTLIVKLTETGQACELRAGSLYVTLLRKLNEQLLVKYQDWLRDKRLEGTVHNLYTFVNEEAESWMAALETIKGLGPDKARPQGRTFAVPQVEEKKSAWKCGLCSQEHGLWKCDQFKALPVDERWNKAREFKVCFRCLSSFHRSTTCRSVRSCSVNGCKSNHHRLLHNPEPRKEYTSGSQGNRVHKPQEEQSKNIDSTLQPITKPTEGEGSSKAYVTSSTSPTDKTEYLALRTVPVLLKNGKKSLRINALLDDASTKSYLNEDVASYLDLVGEDVSLSVRVLNDACTNMKSSLVSCDLESCDGQVQERITAHTTTRVTGNLCAIDWSKRKNKWSHLKNIDFPVTGKRPIVDMLIGLDVSDLHCALKEVRGDPGEPIARLTPLGWTCIAPSSEKAMENVVNMAYFINEEMQLNSLVKQMWEFEEPRTFSLVRPEDKEAEQIVRESLKQVPGGYTIGLPWKSDAMPLENNYSMALSRLESIERKLSKQPEVAKSYQSVLDKYKEKGYVKEVNMSHEVGTKVWYLPHFPVVRMDKTTSKVRPVFDASARYKGVSLNDVVHHGPKLQNDLIDVLTRFRRFPVALVCDITEMYLQVHLQPSDQSVHRFLWRNMDNTVPPKAYQFTRVVFGVNASPYMAQLVAQHNAKVNANEFPRAADTVCKGTYMDDSMDSTETVEEAIKLYQELKTLWNRAGMSPKKWLSNKVEVLETIPKDDCVASLNLEAGIMPVVKTLGVSWLSDPDQFTFVVHPLTEQFHLTKRSFLSRTSTLFDPLGFISPFVIRARMILQELWTAGITWDQDLPIELAQKAMAWFQELPELCNIKVPRALKESGKVIDSQLHVFADTSQAAYGAVAYLRHCYESGAVTVRFVMSRAKVAPLLSVSIPRLELMAAIVGLRVAETAGETCGIKINSVTFWSDSLDVLYWVRGQSRQFKPFVSNRVGEIQSKTDPSQWRYTPTKSNPADKLSRGLTAETLVNDMNWWEGPEYLKAPQEMWPVMNLTRSSSVTEEKRRKYTTSFLVSTQSGWLLSELKWKDTRLDPQRFSKWFTFLNVLAYIIRFVQNCCRPIEHRLKGPLSVNEVSVAERAILRQAQLESFQNELSCVNKRQGLPITSKITPISPALDDDGLLRGNSRLRLADNVAWDTKHPIILPRKHRVTQLIVDQLHRDSNHAGTNTVLALLSAKYWLPGAREEIRESENACMVCRRRRAQPATQIMAPLPAVRTKESLRAFTYVSVDYGGPFLTKQGRGKTRFKRYLCLFACMNTRAVHLEMAYGLDTDSFLNAFYRMTARRGNPYQVISDNGTNFVGADRELKELVKALDEDKIQASTINKGIKWKFNPPAAPHFNGLHEVLIRAAKRAMFHVLNKADLTDEELLTAMVGAEGLLNSRPITYQSSSADDPEPLTPNHFLFNQVGGQFAPESVDTEPFNLRNRWRRIQEVVRHFWKRWLIEWIPSLSTRKKWNEEKADLQVGDIVLVLSKDTPRGKWPLGRITSVFPGPDGHVRTAEVKGVVLRRPIVKLCPLGA